MAEVAEPTEEQPIYAQEDQDQEQEQQQEQVQLAQQEEFYALPEDVQYVKTPSV